MKIWILIILILISCSSCDSLYTKKFNQEAYDEYMSSFGTCKDLEMEILFIDMNKPNFEFYLDNKELGFNHLSNLDTFLTANINLLENHRIGLVGKEDVKTSRIDSVTSLFNKHGRFRFLMVYQKGFWEE